MIKYVILLFISIFSLKCDPNDCEDLLCFTPPNPFQFEILDKNSAENLYVLGELSPNDLKVYESNSGVPREFSFIEENGFNIISIHSIGWETEKVELTLELSKDLLFTLDVEAKRTNENCCSFTKYNEITIQPFEYELNKSNDIYQVYIP